MSAHIDLDEPGDWPRDLQAYLERHRDLFLDREIGQRNRAAVDVALYGLEAVLRSYALIGWHCTRLTGDETANIRVGGMQVPNVAMLHRRIDALAGAGILSKELAGRLKSEHQADDKGRIGRVWFRFSPLSFAGESGIGRFFRHWGGEALYNSHEDDPETGPAIASIGVPCVIEAVVPIASLGNQGFLPEKITRRYFISPGYQSDESVDHEGAITCPLPPANIRRLVFFPSSEFIAITGCDEWNEPIVV